MAGGKRGNQGPVLRNFRKIIKRRYVYDNFGRWFNKLSCGHVEEDRNEPERKMQWCAECEKKDTRP